MHGQVMALRTQIERAPDYLRPHWYKDGFNLHYLDPDAVRPDRPMSSRHPPHT